MTALFNIANTSLLPCVLFVDDEAQNRQAFQSTFRREFKVILASNLQEAWTMLAQHQVHVVIADQRMPGTLGSELLLVRERYPHIRRMLVTAYADLEAVVDAVNRGGVSQYIPKPWDPGQVIEASYGVRRDPARGRAGGYTAQLLETNRQLEFALRQALSWSPALFQCSGPVLAVMR